MENKRKVLIVDDELFVREILKDSLKIRYDVIEGRNGEEAIALVANYKPDLIIMDVEMPGRSGIDICKGLKERVETRRIPVILLTSCAKKEDVILGLEAGADDYITKPMYPPEILARVDAHLRSKGYYAELEHRDLLLLLELSEAMAASRNPMNILRLIVEKMSNVIDIARCSIVSVSSSGSLIVKASSDLKEDLEISIDLRKYPEIGKAIETKKAVVVNDIKNDPLMKSVQEHLKGIEFNSIIVVPIVKKESVIGTFFLRTASSLKDGITERIYKLCQLAANISANALENATLFESMKTAQEYLEEMSIRDGLTRLYNHRHFYNRLDEEFSRAVRYNTPLSLIFFDIDDFKTVNDTCGHTQGDEVLRQIGRIVKNVIRESDIAARYGGDEFAVLLPNTTADGALDLGSRLRSIIHEHTFEGLKIEKITTSTGVATFFSDNVRSFDQLVQLADGAMYESKVQGKNRISRAADHSESPA
ncbi:MAG TPA: diguanylate cyclase [Desulfuromonadales bacterium]|nr:diguanylate cyclase [Desulfuromonadales bacterium]